VEVERGYPGEGLSPTPRDFAGKEGLAAGTQAGRRGG
jgi:hypothetical protein